MSNLGVGGFKRLVNVVGFLHMKNGRIVQSPWCLAVPVALVDQFFAACVHLENQMSNHGVGGFKRMVNVAGFLHLEGGGIVQSPWCLAVPVALVDILFAACVHLQNQMSTHSVGGLKEEVNVVGFHSMTTTRPFGIQPSPERC